MSMFSILKANLTTKPYAISDAVKRIDHFYAEMQITPEEHEELMKLINERANPNMERASEQAQIDALVKSVSLLSERVESLEKRLAYDSGESGDAESSEPLEPVIPEWYRWDGIGVIPWQKGSECVHNGITWVSGVDDNIWEPGSAGLHDNIWARKEESLI